MTSYLSNPPAMADVARTARATALGAYLTRSYSLIVWPRPTYGQLWPRSKPLARPALTNLKGSP